MLTFVSIVETRQNQLREIWFRVSYGERRFAFMFYSSRNAVILVAGNKSETKLIKLYSHLISTSEQRYDRYLEKK